MKSREIHPTGQPADRRDGERGLAAGSRRQGAATFIIVGLDGPTRLALRGRLAWALAALIRARDRGLTPLDDPAPRWSSYVMRLRRKGLAIDTITEAHGGAFAGMHGRYGLRSAVRPDRDDFGDVERP